MLRHMRMKLSTVKLNIIQLFTLHVEQSINYQNEGIYANLCFLYTYSNYSIMSVIGISFFYFFSLFSKYSSL